MDSIARSRNLSGKKFPLSQADHEILDFSDSRISCPEFERQRPIVKTEVTAADLRISAPSRLQSVHTKMYVTVEYPKRKKF